MRFLKLSLLGLALASAAWAQEVVTVEATGEAAIVGNDENRAVEEAKQAAMRAAVEQVAGVTVSATSQSLNSVLVRDQVVAHTSGYVKNVEIDKASIKKVKGVLSLKIKAQVGKSELAKDVEAAKQLVKRFGRPSLVVMIQEQTLQIDAAGKAGGITTTDSAATVLTEQFRKDGWEILDPAAAAGKLKVNAAASLGAVEAKEIGNLTRADYILYGTVVLKNQVPTEIGFNQGKQVWFPVTGEYDLSLFATDSGVQIGKYAGKLVYAKPGESEMVALKGQTVGYERSAFDTINRKKDDIIVPVRQGALESFRNKELNGAELLVAASGLQNYAEARDFKKSLEGVSGVKEVEQKDFKGGVASYRVTFSGSSGDFADKVGAATHKKKKIDVTEVTGNKVALAVAK